MTVKHVVWMKFKDGVDAQRIGFHSRECQALVEKVPCLENLEFGTNYSDRADGLTHCIIVTVADRDALTEYLEHPVHKPVAAALVGDLETIKAMDIEF